MFKKLQKIYDTFQKKHMTETGGTCEGCDYCCTSKFAYPPISSLEYGYIEKKKGTEKKDAFKNFMEKRNLPRCPFYSSGCTVYEIRPLCCRLFGIYGTDTLLPKNCIYKNNVKKVDERILFRTEEELREFQILKIEYDLKNSTKKEEKIKLLINLAEEYIAQSNMDKAEESLDKAEEIDKKNPSCYFYRGLTCKRKEDTAGAIENLEKSLTFGGGKDYPYIYEYLGMIYYETNNLEKAGEILKKSIPSPQVYTILTLIKLKEASHYCRKIIELEPYNSVAAHLMEKHSLSDF